MTIKDSIADIPLRSRLVAAGLVFAIVSVVAYRQYVANYEWHERYSLLEWMFHPVDWNVDAGLPDIRNINAVQVVNSRPWIAGNGAFLAFGDGIGTRWTRVTYDEQAGRFTMPEASTVAARWHIDGLVATTVYAAAQQSAAQRPVEQQKEPPPVQQGPPVEQKAPPVQQGPPAEQKAPPEEKRPPVDQKAPQPAPRPPIEQKAPSPNAPPLPNPPPAPRGYENQAPAPVPSRLGLDLIAFANCTEMHCELASRGTWFVTDDGGATWTFAPAVRSSVPAQRSPTVYESPGGRGWRLANDALARTDDGGRTWVPLNRKAAAALPGHVPVGANAQYWAFVPPWYVLAVLLIGLFVSVEERVERPSDPDAHKDPDVIAPQGTADKPLERGEPDALELNAIANGLGFFLSNEKTKPPLVIAINGRWGSGKSSLMNLVRQYLESNGSRPVWFNAWHHQKEDQLLAALLDAVKAQAVPTLANGSGWMFRARLAAERLRHAWFNAAIAAAVVVLLWQAELYLKSRFEEASLGHLIHMTLTSTFFTRDTLATEGLLPLLKFIEGWTATAGALLFTVTRAVRGIRAFASNPSSLLASDAPGSSAKRLKEQTAFRQRFAREFSDVTRALGRQRMLILIDDLDRCRPEKVREVLEAVNFLVSSGECFVILGMAREIVRHCVGLSFARVVDTMPWGAFDLPPEEINRVIERTQREFADAAGGKKVPDVGTAARRAAFAELFLDKLVQIEISVPEPTTAQKKKLFETDDLRRKQESEAERRAERWLHAGVSAANILQPVLYGAVVAGVVVALGLQVGRGLRTMIERSEPVQLQAGLGGATLIDGELSPTPPSQPTAAPGELNTSSTPGPSAYLLEGAPVLTDAWYSSWPFALAVVSLLSVSIASLRRIPQQPVQDAEAFTAAMLIWHPLVLTSGARNTPRTARRFQNRVRYLAMRQRALTLPPQFSLGARLVRTLVGVGRPSGTSSVDAAAGIIQQLAAAAPVRIPEDMLVAFAAIHEFAPEWLADFAEFNKHLIHHADNPDEVSRAIAKHEEGKLFSWNSGELASYRSLYLHLSSEVDRSQLART